MVPVKVEVQNIRTYEYDYINQERDKTSYKTQLKIPLLLSILINASQELQITIRNLTFIVKKQYINSDNFGRTSDLLSFINNTLNLKVLTDVPFLLRTQYLNFMKEMKPYIEGFLTTKEGINISEKNPYLIISRMLDKYIDGGEPLKEKKYMKSEWEKTGDLIPSDLGNKKDIITLSEVFQSLQDSIKVFIENKIKEEIKKEADISKIAFSIRNNYESTDVSFKNILYLSFFANNFGFSETTKDMNFDDRIGYITTLLQKQKAGKMNFNFMRFFSNYMIDILMIFFLLLYPFVVITIFFKNLQVLFFRYVMSFLAFQVWAIVINFIDAIMYIFSLNDLGKAISLLPFVQNSYDIDGILTNFSVYPFLITLLYPTLLATVMFLFNNSMGAQVLSSSSVAPGVDPSPLVKGNWQYDNFSSNSVSILGYSAGNFSGNNVQKYTESIGPTGKNLQQLAANVEAINKVTENSGNYFNLSKDDISFLKQLGKKDISKWSLGEGNRASRIMKDIGAKQEGQQLRGLMAGYKDMKDLLNTQERKATDIESMKKFDVSDANVRLALGNEFAKIFHDAFGLQSSYSKTDGKTKNYSGGLVFFKDSSGSSSQDKQDRDIIGKASADLFSGARIENGKLAFDTESLRPLYNAISGKQGNEIADRESLEKFKNDLLTGNTNGYNLFEGKIDPAQYKNFTTAASKFLNETAKSKLELIQPKNK